MDKNYLLHKYLNKEATPEEVEHLLSDPEYADLLKIADSSSGMLPPEFNAGENFDAIQHNKIKRIGTSSNNTGYKRLLQVAALVVLVVVSYVFISSMDTQVSTGIGQKTTFNLPDESEVQLNAASKISYNKRNWDKKRTLTLDGEAYFKVTKGNAFNVETPQGTVTVLGTQFNVFSRDTVFNIKCFEGLVSVAFADTLIRLPAGNRLKVENNKLIVHDNTGSVEPSWIAQESSFDNATLSTVLSELQYQYPVKITSHANITLKRFTGSFTHSDLESALRSVCEPLRLAYTIDGDEVTIYVK